MTVAEEIDCTLIGSGFYSLGSRQLVRGASVSLVPLCEAHRLARSEHSSRQRLSTAHAECSETDRADILTSMGMLEDAESALSAWTAKQSGHASELRQKELRYEPVVTALVDEFRAALRAKGVPANNWTGLGNGWQVSVSGGEILVLAEREDWYWIAAPGENSYRIVPFPDRLPNDVETWQETARVQFVRTLFAFLAKS